MFKPENRKLFGKIIKRSNVVLVCRASPKQKAEVVEFAKEMNPKMVSLAIGDGGNDVSMIKEADVGIGIFGKEGYQAVTASDYAIGEFQFLKRLMFVHGRYNTRRITVFITQFLLKNLIFSLSQLSFAFMSAYSGQSFFEPGYVSIFNTFASQLVICAYAIYDQDISPRLTDKKTKLLLPYLYAETRELISFNIKDFMTWYLWGFFVGTMNFFVSYYSFINQQNNDGKTYDLWQFSFSPYVTICIVTLSYTGLYIGAWHWLWVVFYCLHWAIFYPGWVFLYNEWPDSHVYKNQLDFYSHIHFWMVTFVVASIAILPVVVMKQFKSLFFPKLIDLVQRKIDKDLNIEEKLKIDFVNLEKDLDFESDEDDKSVRMSQGVANNVRTSNPGTLNTIDAQESSREDVGSVNEDDESMANSIMHKSEYNSKSSGNLLAVNTKRNLKHERRYAKSHQKDRTSQSPRFEKFSDNVLKLRLNNSSNSSSSKKRKVDKKKLKFGRKKKSNINKFYPQMSSVSGGTIHEKSIEEDREDSTYNSPENKRYEEEKGEFPSSQEEDYDRYLEAEDEEDEAEDEGEGAENSSEAPSSSNFRSENMHSLEASSIADGAKKLGDRQRSAALLGNMNSKLQDRRTIEVEDGFDDL